ncbi:hypothetical protein HDV05_001911 [Chytridiales sp. JEL 0842]|nr:hypothetical protein HDV05_001911 [Chytridiales sp. JEL 0842]
MLSDAPSTPTTTNPPIRKCKKARIEGDLIQTRVLDCNSVGNTSSPIRVHDPQLVDASDSDSVSSWDEEDDHLNYLKSQLEDHRAELEDEMKEWEVRPLITTSDRLVVKPLASMMDHMVLHPAIYTFRKPVGDPSGLKAVATFLGAPHDWQDRFSRAFTEIIARSFQRLKNFPPETTSESEIQAHFIGAVVSLAGMLGIDVSVHSM